MTIRLTILVVVSWLVVHTGVPAAFAQSGDVAIVVNERNSVNNVSRADLRKILLGEKRAWGDGSVVKIFVRGPGTRERAALLTVLGMSEGDYKKYWTTQVFRGEAQSEPVALPSNGMQKEALAAFPGGVALVSSSDVKQGMKVIKVDGHGPGEDGYLLH